MSHNMDNIQKLTNRCIILNKGRVSFDGNPYEGIEKYLLEYKKNHIGTVYTETRKRYGNHGSKAKILSIDPKDVNTGFNYKILSPIEFFVNIGLNEKVDSDLRLGLTLKNYNNNPILSTTSNYIEPNRKRIRLLLSIKDIKLAPGTYKLSISLGCGQLNEVRTEYDILQDVLELDIFNAGNKNDVMYNWQSSYGYFYHNNTLIEEQ